MPAACGAPAEPGFSAALLHWRKQLVEGGVGIVTPKNLIVIVEDNEDFQDLYGMVADKAGFEVERILDGEAAMQRLEREPIPTILLLDSRLPRVMGDEILLAARSKTKWSRVPIYMITADLRGAQKYKNSVPGEPHADGVIEKGAESIHKLRELFEKYRDKAVG
jgi:CheY-like chemotaxis protein